METTNNLNDETIDMLNRLIEANIDSCEGYKEAANDIDNPRLSQLFLRLANERQNNVTQLQQYVRSNNESPEDDGTVRGSIHQTWLKFRAAINGGDEEVVLIEASRGEDHIKELYEDLLKENPGSALSSLLHQQFKEINEDYNQIKRLRQAYD